MRISDWSSDVCSSDLIDSWLIRVPLLPRAAEFQWTSCPRAVADGWRAIWYRWLPRLRGSESRRTSAGGAPHEHDRSEEHTSELQSLMRISYAVFCLKKKIQEHEDIIRRLLHYTHTMLSQTMKFTAVILL